MSPGTSRPGTAIADTGAAEARPDHDIAQNLEDALLRQMGASPPMRRSAPSSANRQRSPVQLSGRSSPSLPAQQRLHGSPAISRDSISPIRSPHFSSGAALSPEALLAADKDATPGQAASVRSAFPASAPASALEQALSELREAAAQVLTAIHSKQVPPPPSNDPRVASPVVRRSPLAAPASSGPQTARRREAGANPRLSSPRVSPRSAPASASSPPAPRIRSAHSLSPVTGKGLFWVDVIPAGAGGNSERMRRSPDGRKSPMQRASHHSENSPSSAHSNDLSPSQLPPAPDNDSARAFSPSRIPMPRSPARLPDVGIARTHRPSVDLSASPARSPAAYFDDNLARGRSNDEHGDDSYDAEHDNSFSQLGRSGSGRVVHGSDERAALDNQHDVSPYNPALDTAEAGGGGDTHSVDNGAIMAASADDGSIDDETLIAAAHEHFLALGLEIGEEDFPAAASSAGGGGGGNTALSAAISPFDDQPSRGHADTSPGWGDAMVPSAVGPDEADVSGSNVTSAPCGRDFGTFSVDRGVQVGSPDGAPQPAQPAVSAAASRLALESTSSVLRGVPRSTQAAAARPMATSDGKGNRVQPAIRRLSIHEAAERAAAQTRTVLKMAALPVPLSEAPQAKPSSVAATESSSRLDLRQRTGPSSGATVRQAAVTSDVASILTGAPSGLFTSLPAAVVPDAPGAVDRPASTEITVQSPSAPRASLATVSFVATPATTAPRPALAVASRFPAPDPGEPPKEVTPEVRRSSGHDVRKASVLSFLRSYQPSHAPSSEPLRAQNSLGLASSWREARPAVLPAPPLTRMLPHDLTAPVIRPLGRPADALGTGARSLHKSTDADSMVERAGAPSSASVPTANVGHVAPSRNDSVVLPRPGAPRPQLWQEAGPLDAASLALQQLLARSAAGAAIASAPSAASLAAHARLLHDPLLPTSSRVGSGVSQQRSTQRGFAATLGFELSSRYLAPAHDHALGRFGHATQVGNGVSGLRESLTAASPPGSAPTPPAVLGSAVVSDAAPVTSALPGAPAHHVSRVAAWASATPSMLRGAAPPTATRVGPPSVASQPWSAPAAAVVSPHRPMGSPAAPLEPRAVPAFDAADLSCISSGSLDGILDATSGGKQGLSSRAFAGLSAPAAGTAAAATHDSTVTLEPGLGAFVSSFLATDSRQLYGAAHGSYEAAAPQGRRPGGPAIISHSSSSQLQLQLLQLGQSATAHAAGRRPSTTAGSTPSLYPYDLDGDVDVLLRAKAALCALAGTVREFAERDL